MVRTLYQGGPEQTQLVSQIIYQFSNAELQHEMFPLPGKEDQRKPRRDVAVLERLAVEFPLAERVPF